MIKRGLDCSKPFKRKPWRKQSVSKQADAVIKPSGALNTKEGVFPICADRDTEWLLAMTHRSFKSRKLCQKCVGRGSKADAFIRSEENPENFITASVGFLFYYWKALTLANSV